MACSSGSELRLHAFCTRSSTEMNHAGNIPAHHDSYFFGYRLARRDTTRLTSEEVKNRFERSTRKRAAEEKANSCELSK